MPLQLKKNTAGGWFALWRIDESVGQLEAIVSLADIAACAAISNPRRRSERLAWRAALRSVLPGNYEISYDGVGAPCLDGVPGWIGVSHCQGYAAVIYSLTAPCAVDVELMERNFARAASRYISPQEATLPCAAEPWFGAVVWCAKETMYKLSGRKELDLLTDIKVLQADRTRAVGEVLRQGRVEMEVMMDDTICLVYTC